MKARDLLFLMMILATALWAGGAGCTDDDDGGAAVSLAPDGSLLSARLSKSSGNSAWDNAVLRAVERSDPLPRDDNGKAPSSFTITFRPKD